jgi:predicted lysophospholipase L1 biosynthesis ABC-type transport system permease subunit
MKISLISGRDFTENDAYPGSAIVNEAFAKQYFEGENPVGRSFEKVEQQGRRLRFGIVGLTRDARYRNLREPILPTVYVPLQAAKGETEFQTYSRATFIVRTATGNPLAMASVLRDAVAETRSELRVSNVQSQADINASHMVRERLLAVLALFFASVALLLAGIGLYGVLRYTVLQQRREIAIRLAIGARGWQVAHGAASGVLTAVAAGAVIGLLVGIGSARYIESLLYGVRANDPSLWAIPTLTIFAAAMLAAAPAILRVVRIDPATTLRAE